MQNAPYPVRVRATLVRICSFDHCHYYLYGRQFSVRGDPSALISLLSFDSWSENNEPPLYRVPAPVQHHSPLSPRLGQHDARHLSRAPIAPASDAQLDCTLRRVFLLDFHTQHLRFFLSWFHIWSKLRIQNLETTAGQSNNQ